MLCLLMQENFKNSVPNIFARIIGSFQTYFLQNAENSC